MRTTNITLLLAAALLAPTAAQEPHRDQGALAERLASLPLLAPITTGPGGETDCAGPHYHASFHDGFVFRVAPPEPQRAAPAMRWTTESARWGTKPLRVPDAHAEIRHDGERAERLGLDLVEVYDASPHGIEQSFRIPFRGDSVGDLELVGRIDGARLEVRPPEHAPLSLLDDRGRSIATIGAVTVIDAEGRRLAVASASDGERMRMVVPAAWLKEATFPVTIDPVWSPIVIDRSTAPVVAVDIARDTSCWDGDLLISFSRSFGFDTHLFVIRTEADFSSPSLLYSEVRSGTQVLTSGLTMVGNRALLVLRRASLPFPFPFLGAMLLATRCSGGAHRPLALPDPLILAYSAAPGGASAGTPSRGAIVWADRTGVRASTVDVTTASASTPVTIATGDLTDVAITPGRFGEGSEWVVAWIDHSPRVHVLGARLSASGAVAESRVILPVDLDRSYATPKVAGGHGRFLLGWLQTGPAQPPTIQALRFDWSAAGYSPGCSLELDRVAADDVLGGVAYDDLTEGHWGISYSRRVPGADRMVTAVRVAHDCCVIDRDTVLAPIGGDATLSAAAFDRRTGDFLIAAESAEPMFPLYGRRNIGWRGAEAVLLGSACGSGLIGNTKVPLRGTDRLRITMARATPSQPCVLFAGSSRSGLPPCSPDVIPAVYLAMITGSTGWADVPVPIPCNVLPTSIYWQWLYLDGTSLRSTQTLETRIR